MKEKGITLIALVITVIVLLILAGAAVSIGLNGDNLFAKANEAKDEWNEKVEENNEILENLATILNTLVEEDAVTADKINSRIGENINYNSPEESGYTGDWQIFYATDSEVFIIAEQIAETLDQDICDKILNGQTEYNYTGVNDMINKYQDHAKTDGLGYDYGKRYNSLWINEVVTGNWDRTSANAKYTAYFCDPDNWQKYVTGKASYATAGPTMQLIELSIAAKLNNDSVIGNSLVGAGGYGHFTDEIVGDIEPLYEPYASSIESWIIISPEEDTDTTTRMMVMEIQNNAENPCAYVTERRLQ